MTYRTTHFPLGRRRSSTRIEHPSYTAPVPPLAHRMTHLLPGYPPTIRDDDPVLAIVNRWLERWPGDNPINDSYIRQGLARVVGWDSRGAEILGHVPHSSLPRPTARRPRALPSPIPPTCPNTDRSIFPSLSLAPPAPPPAARTPTPPAPVVTSPWPAPPRPASSPRGPFQHAISYVTSCFSHLGRVLLGPPHPFHGWRRQALPDPHPRPST